MKKYLILIIVLIIAGAANSQVVYNYKIDSLVQLVSIQQLSKFDKEISGDTLAVIGGIPQRIVTRYEGTQGNLLSAQYILEKFSSYGLAARYQGTSPNIYNVIGWKTGTKYPNQYFVFGAHYDNIIRESTLDTIYGADDDGTGISILLEAARILNGFPTDYSIAFVAFNYEETWGGGSMIFTDSARIKGDSIIGAINCEMMGYDGNNEFKAAIITNDKSLNLAGSFTNTKKCF